jgi:cell division protein FtsB
MAKNRKYQTAAIRFGPAMKAFVLCLFIGGSGVGYVWQKNQLHELGSQIKAREQRLAGLKEQNQKLRRQLGEMYSPKYLERRGRELGLQQPALQAVLRIPEPQPEHHRSPASAEQQYAAGRPPPVGAIAP